MMSPELEAKVRAKTTTARILWAVFTWTLVGIMLVAYFVSRSELENLQVPETPGNAQLPLLGFALVDLLLALVLRAYLKKREILRKDLRPGMPPELALQSVASRWLVSLLVPMGLNEVVAMEGLVFCFLTKNFTASLPFFLVPFVLTLTLIPRDTTLLEALEPA